MKNIIRILLMGVFCLVLLGYGGYTLASAKHEIKLKDPFGVLSPVVSDVANNLANDDVANSFKSADIYAGEDDMDELEANLEKVKEQNAKNDRSTSMPDLFTDPGLEKQDLNIDADDTLTKIESPYLNANADTKIKKDKLPNNVSVSTSNSIRVRLDDTELELTSTNVLEFIKWIDNNWEENSDLTYNVNKQVFEDVSAETKEEIVYTKELTDTEMLNALVSSIRVVNDLSEDEENDDYDRTKFESPTHSYELDNKKVNRNDYSWKTSEWFNSEDFTYMCPYTGIIIYDDDDNKSDSDFGNLDYDHIVSLHTAYKNRPDWWTEKEMNEYAYDQAVGVDVYNKSNRSKSDKTPSEWLPDINVEDFCYHYLLICNKYDLSMTQEDLDLCYTIISEALESGETVTVLNDYICEDIVAEEE